MTARPERPLSLRRTGLLVLMLMLVYAGAIALADRGRIDARVLLSGLAVLPAACGLTLLNLLVRYVRWRWLLRGDGFDFPYVRGLAAYCAGFAFTASPGKVGELFRIRYFQQMGVPPVAVFGCFVFERLLDLLVLLLLASLILHQAAGSMLAVVFVGVVLAAIILVPRQRALFHVLVRFCRHKHWARAARLVGLLRRGIAAALVPRNLARAPRAMLLGALAWGVQASVLLVVLAGLGVSMDWLYALSIQPVAMLIGAASMLPGGVGSTELSMTLLLQHGGAELGSATMAAVLTRLSSIWFAMLVGIAASAWLELRR